MAEIYFFFADIHIYGRIPDLHHQDVELESHRAVKLAKPLNYDHVIRMWVLTLCQVGSMLKGRRMFPENILDMFPIEFKDCHMGKQQKLFARLPLVGWWAVVLRSRRKPGTRK